MATATLVCSSCEESELELYDCETCSESANCTDKSTNERELLCEICLGAHVRKGHKVATLKGREPLICSQHRRLHNQFCRTCDVTFCPKCLGEHSKHEMGGIDERAVEIKKEVFEMLTKLELDEKPLRAKKESISDLKKIHEGELSDVRGQFEKEIEDLRTIGLKRINENLKQLEKEEKELVDDIDQVLGLQKSSRDLLSLTSPHLINDIKQVRVDFDETCRKFEDALSTEYRVGTPKFDNLKESFVKLGEEIDEKLKISFFKTEKKLSEAKKATKKFAVAGTDLSNFLVTIENGQMKLSKVRVRANSCSLEYEHLGELEFTDDIVSRYSVFDINYSCSPIILSSTNVYRIDIKHPNVCKKTELVLPTFQCIVCPYINHCSHDDEVDWCYWLQDGQVLKFTHDTDLEIQCSSKPKYSGKEIGGWELCFVTENNEILIVDLANSRHRIIPSSKHRVTPISHVTFLDIFLFIWSTENKSITVMYSENNQWNVVETQNWQDATQLISFKHPELEFYLFLPALKGTSLMDDSDYAFLFFLELLVSNSIQ